MLKIKSNLFDVRNIFQIILSVSVYLAMPALEVRCTLYSFWARRDKKWVTTNADEKTEILLSLLSSEDDPDGEDGDTWTVLALLLNQDVLQRLPLSPGPAGAEKITFLGGESSLLVMSGQDHKWRVELESEKSLVQMLDQVKDSGLPRVEVMCLASWQKDITMRLVRDWWLDDAEYGKVIEEMALDSQEVGNVRMNLDLVEMVEKMLRDTFVISDVEGIDCSDSILNNSDDLLNVSKDLLDEDVE